MTIIEDTHNAMIGGFFDVVNAKQIKTNCDLSLDRDGDLKRNVLRFTLIGRDRQNCLVNEKRQSFVAPLFTK